jgi:predicted phosphoribosyltransferase
MQRFDDRSDAGRSLAAALAHYGGRDDVVVLALPRGGVPVGYEVATALGADLDVIVVRKLGAPGQEELALGAIAAGGTIVLNDDVVHDLGVPEATVDDIARREGQELARRERAYRGSRPAADLRDRTVILVDDGLATGATMRAAVESVRQRRPERLVVAVPTAAADTRDEIAREVDEVVCVTTPTPFRGVGMWYRDFAQTSDDEVMRLLAAARRSQ